MISLVDDDIMIRYYSSTPLQKIKLRQELRHTMNDRDQPLVICRIRTFGRPAGDVSGKRNDRRLNEPRPDVDRIRGGLSAVVITTEGSFHSFASPTQTIRVRAAPISIRRCRFIFHHSTERKFATVTFAGPNAAIGSPS